LNNTSIRSRFLASVVANVGRAGISFVTGILIARGLTPIGYGDLFFLLGSFAAIRALLNLGASNAFYTFIAQERKGTSFYIAYFVWLLLQFLVTLLAITVFLPDRLLDQIWLGHSKEVILLAFLSSFLQQQVWSTIIQICEAVRKTIMVQMMGLVVVLSHFVFVVLLLWMGWLSVNVVLISISIEYFVATLVIWWLLRGQPYPSEQKFCIKKTLVEYWIFCRPLIIVAIVSFLYEFLDRWLLQRFGGAEQQGFYQISAQFAAVSLLATVSILNILWKEIAESYKQGDHDRVNRLYHKVSRSLLMLGAVVACFLIPWSEQITVLFLGNAYQEAWPVLAVMFLYPIHQSIGQINGTMFMACERTSPYMYLSLFGMLISMPVTYMLIVPENVWLISGFGLGALGLALKMVGVNIFMVNVQGFMLARYHGWKFDWWYQVEGIIVLLVLSLSVKTGIQMFMTSDAMLVISLVVSFVLYISAVFAYVWLRPSQFGVNKAEILRSIQVIRNKNAG